MKANGTNPANHTIELHVSFGLEEGREQRTSRDGDHGASIKPVSRCNHDRSQAQSKDGSEAQEGDSIDLAISHTVYSQLCLVHCLLSTLVHL